MLTQEGQAWLAALIAGELEGGSVLVSDGDQSAQAPIERIDAQRVTASDGVESFRVMALATFGENDANFEWLESAVVLADGTEVDRTVEDRGRKAQGAIWSIEAALDVVA